MVNFVRSLSQKDVDVNAIFFQFSTIPLIALSLKLTIFYRVNLSPIKKIQFSRGFVSKPRK